MIQLTLANQGSPGNYRPTLKVLQKQVLKNNWIPGCWKKYLNKFNSTDNWLEFIKNSRCRKKFSGKIQIKTGIFTNAAFGNERCLIYPKFGGKKYFIISVLYKILYKLVLASPFMKRLKENS